MHLESFSLTFKMRFDTGIILEIHLDHIKPKVQYRNNYMLYESNIYVIQEKSSWRE